MPMEIAKYIDHTLLKPDATQADVDRVVQEALAHHFFSVMIQPYWVAHVHKLLQGSDVKTSTVIGFPLGANLTKIKVCEAKQAIQDGADELDMVMNIGAFKGGDDTAVLADIQAVVAVAHEHQRLVKVIIETALLSKTEIKRAATIVADAGADFVKTSTGFAKGGATQEDVQLLYRTVGNRIDVKAAGGIHTSEAARKLIESGASRLGTSASMAIIENYTD